MNFQRIFWHSVFVSALIDLVAGQAIGYFFLHHDSVYDPMPSYLQGLFVTGAYWMVLLFFWIYESLKSVAANLILFKRTIAVAFLTDLKGFNDLQPYSFSLQEPSEYFSQLGDNVLDANYEGLKNEPNFQKARKAYISAGMLSTLTGTRKFGTAKGLEDATDRLTSRRY